MLLIMVFLLLAVSSQPHCSSSTLPDSTLLFIFEYLKFVLANQEASHVAPGKSGLHVRGEGERVIALEPW